MASGLNFGVRKSLPLLIGVSTGFTIMLLLIGLGFGQLFDLFPQLSLTIKIAGTTYLLYLAWLIARSSRVDVANQKIKPFEFIKGTLFQWVHG